MIIGHNRIWNFLNKSAQNGRLAHAYLFLGSHGLGKKTLAIEFVKKLLCENGAGCGQCASCRQIEQNRHPDVLMVSSQDGAEIKIEQVRQLQHQISLTPFCAPKKIAIIDGVESLTLEAANCLLKTLEEPPQKNFLILISSDSRKILPTIISRCQTIKFLSVRSQNIAEGLEKLGAGSCADIEPIVKFSGGRPGAAISFLREGGWRKQHDQLIADLARIQKSDLCDRFKFAQKLAQDIPSAQAILSDWLIWFRDRILEDNGLKDLMLFAPAAGVFGPLLKIKNIIEAKRLLSESSFNHRLVLENLMMKI